MKIKILPVLVVFSLLFTALNVIAVNPQDENPILIFEENHQISFSQKTIQTVGEYVTVDVDEANTFISTEGQPVMPVYTKTFIFPRGTKINDIDFTISEIKSEILTQKLQPASRPVHRISLDTSANAVEEELVEDESVYSSSEMYPDSWYDYKVYCGLKDGQDSIFVKVNTYPTRYSPAENTLYSIDNVDISVKYEMTSNFQSSASSYDLVIIAPQKFKLFLLPLYMHKMRNGIKTKIQTVEDIYENFDGRDEPEQIKYFIKHAKEEWGIKYVLLVGGLKTHYYANDRESVNVGSKAWYVPVRYVIPDKYHSGHISDLYYADLYKWNETAQDYEFEDWDNNSNGTFAEHKEQIDLMPDVYYGRLPCRNVFEVYNMVKKIIRYERPSIFDKPWMDRMITCGGQTFNFYEGQPDGEWLCNLSLEYMNDTVQYPVRVFSSNNGTDDPVPTAPDIINEFSKGAGFVMFQGHGSASSWDTHWADKEMSGEDDVGWAGPFMTYHMRYLNNRYKQPIVVVGGCHNGIFNTTLIQSMNDAPNLENSNYHTYGIPILACFSWKLTAMRMDGAISCTGCTDYGIGYTSNPLSLSAVLELNFFYKIGQDGVEHLGEAHGGAITKYIEDIDMSGDYSSNVYAITEYELFGDPSLKIGGY